jgi:hypothetical protein
MVDMALLSHVEPDYQSALCYDGYEGHLCSTCGPHKSKTRTYHCESCNAGASVMWVAVGTLLGAAYLWFVSASTIKDAQRPWGTLKVSDAMFCLTWFLQLLFVLTTIPVIWPPSIAWLPKTAETMLSSLSSSTSSLACLLQPSNSIPSVAGQMMIVQMCLMLVLPGVVVLLELFVVVCKPVMCKLRACLSTRSCMPAAMPPRGRRGAASHCDSHSGTFDVKHRLIITVLSSLLFFYPTILQTTMSLFVCKNLDPAGGSDLVYQVSMQGSRLSRMECKSLAALQQSTAMFVPANHCICTDSGDQACWAFTSSTSLPCVAITHDAVKPTGSVKPWLVDVRSGRQVLQQLALKVCPGIWTSLSTTLVPWHPLGGGCPANLGLEAQSAAGGPLQKDLWVFTLALQVRHSSGQSCVPGARLPP